MYKLVFLIFFILSSFVKAQSPKERNWVDLMNDPKENFYDVVDAFEQYWNGKSIEKGRGWKQFKRWEAFMEPRVFPSGERNTSNYLFNAFNSAEGISSQTYSPGIGDWSLVGPTNGNSLNGIGRINAIAFHPTDNNIIFAGSPAGGLWKSTDDGSSWTTNTDLLPNLGVSAIVIDPDNSNTMYIGTGDRDGGDTYSIGVLKSIDGGQTWGATGLSFNVSQSYRVTGLIMHHDSSNFIIASTRAGIYKSIDAGDSWTVTQGGSFQCIVQIPGSNKIFAGTSSNGEIWMSTDFGSTWTKITNGLPSSGRRVELAVTPDDTNYVYAIYGAANNGLYGIYRTTDGGISWSQRHGASPNLLDWSTTGSGSGGQAWYDLTIAVSPQNKNVVLTGGVNIWRSNNGGSSFSLSGHWYGGGGVSFVHADHHCLIFRPGSNELYAGCDGGVYKSSNGGVNNSWVSRNQGLAITQYYKIGTTDSDPSLTIAGAQDNGTHLNDNGWNKVGVQIHHIDPVNKGDVVWSTTPFGLSQIGRLFKDGIYDASKKICLVGSSVSEPMFYECISGFSVKNLLSDKLKDDNVRVISGNVLSGTSISTDGYLGFYDNMITVIPEGDNHEFLGWIMPIFNKLSFQRAFGLLSFLNPGKKYNLDTNTNGELRAFVQSGVFEKVLPMDIYPTYLFKAILANDYDEMEELGIYELLEEDVALCEFVDVSKNEIQKLLRRGLNMLNES